MSLSKTYDDGDHACGGLAADKEGTKGQDNNRHRNSDDGEVELRIVCIGRDDYQELDRESEEKEEIEFQQGNVDLEHGSASNPISDMGVMCLTWYVRYRRFMRRSALICL